MKPCFAAGTPGCTLGAIRETALMRVKCLPMEMAQWL